jgi:hypothetical protein
MEAFMNRGDGGIEPSTIQTIQACLEKHFVGVKFSQHLRPTFAFHHGIEKQSWHLVFNEQLLADHTAHEVLQHFIEHKVIPKALSHPGKRIQVSRYRDITVEERQVS